MPIDRELPPQGTGTDVRGTQATHKSERDSPFPKTSMPRCKIPRTDMEVSRMAYGCADLAPWTRDPLSSQDVAKAERAIRAAIESDITLFDLADLYGFGKAEEAFGKVLRRSPGLRQKIFIQSKCGQIFPEGWRDFGDPIRVDLSASHILHSVERILERLGTDRLDILLLHAPDALAQPDEIARVFDELHRNGKVRNFGVSNFAAPGIALLQRHVRQPLVVNQIQIGLANAQPISDGLDFTLQISRTQEETRLSKVSAGGNSTANGTLDFCRLNDIQIQAYSPMPRELVTPPADPSPALKHAIETLQAIAKARNAEPSAVALAWLLRHPAEILPLIGSTNPAHIVENCTAPHVTLSHDEWYRLFAAAAGI
jgi:predicted oxidoreductase